MMRRRLLFASIEQALVSATSFLVVVLCASSLPHEEMGKLGYIISAVMATVVFNFTLIFQFANTYLPKADSPFFYRASLYWLQIILAITIAIFILSAFSLLGDVLNWKLSKSESILMIVFLLMQQLSDFARRNAYLTENIKGALIVSTCVLLVRTILLFIMKPKGIDEVLEIFVLSLIVGCAGFVGG